VKLLYSYVCEFARARPDGRLDAEGIFHELYAPGFPAEQSEITLVATLEWEAHERGVIPFSVDLLEPAGSPVLSASAETEVTDFGPHHGPPLTRLVLPIDKARFPTAGTYRFVLTVGEEKFAMAHLHLIHVPGDN
jgi:hypothetical protein